MSNIDYWLIRTQRKKNYNKHICPLYKKKVRRGNNFTINSGWWVIINFNLNLSLKLFLYSLIIVSNNYLFIIYCENIMNIAFLVM